MDKYEYKVRADEIKELIARGDYLQAAEIADTIDWRRVKSVMMLCTISDLYKINRRYEDARDMLLLAYERRPGGRTICYSLCELSIKMEEYVQAVEYYKEFVQVAPKDTGRYILQYKLYEAQDVSLEERIEVLEVLKKRDYREKWAYELAYLYHRVGLATRCVEECDEMILWFGEGRYVIKAMELKMLHQPLTPEQQEKYDHRFLPRPTYKGPQPMETASEGREEAQPAEQMMDPTLGDTKVYTPINMEKLLAEQAHKNQSFMEEVTEVEPEIIPEIVPEEEEMDIHVKTMDVGKYNTMNLQAELAAGLREILGEESAETIDDPITRAIVAPMMEADTEHSESARTDEIDETNFEEEQIEESEVFFGETGEIGDLGNYERYAAQGVEEILPEETPHQTVPDVTAEIVMEQMRLEGTGEEPEEAPETELSPELADVLSQGADGQISLVVPESENIEKQITGQMCIEDILAEWERVKRENEEKRREEVRKHVLQQTGTMFSQFEASVRDGLLEQLESGQIESVAEAEMMANAAVGEEGVLEEEYLEEFEENPLDDEYEEEYTEEYTENEIAEEEFSEEASEELAEEAAYEETEEEAAEEAAPEATEEEAAEEAAPEEVEEEAAEEAAYEETEEEAAEEAAPEETEEEVAEEAVPEEVEEEAAEKVAPEEVEEEAAEEAAPEETEEEVTEEAVPEEAKADAEEDTTEQSADKGETTDKITEAIWAVGEGEEDEEEIEDLDEPDEHPAVERDKAKVRALTRDEKELYATFIQSKSAREQLVQALDNISLAAYTGNVIITGEEGMDTLTLAKNMVREIQMTDSNFSGKVAKISGSALNKRDVAAIIRDLENGALIIQKAADLNSKTAAVLNKSLQQENLGIVVVLEDTKRAMNHFLSEHPTLHNCFTARMDVEALSDDTLVAFGRQYAREMEYAIDEMGMLALHTRIADMQTSDHVVTVMEVKKIVDEAIARADKKTVGHFFDVLLAKRYDAEDMIILGEKDFV